MMATDRGYLDFVLNQLSGLDSVRYRAMMGEYVLYYREKVVGGVYDNRLLVKLTPGARAFLSEAVEEPPYPGAGAMLLVDCLENRAKLQELFAILYDELPARKPKK